MEKIQTKDAPAAVGPYNQAIKTGNLVFTAGQIPIDPETNELLEGDIEIQTKQVMKNLKAVLEASGSSLERAVKVTVYLSDMNNYLAMNQVYAEYFTNNPARATVEVARLPKDVLVEIDVIAECD